MEAEKVEKKISQELAQCPPTDTAKTCRFAARVVAKEVIKLADADKYDALQVQDAAWHDIEDKHLADLATAQAQVAVMAEAIEAVGFLKYGHPELAEWIECRWCRTVSRGSVIKHREDCQRQQALSAAPKAVCVAEAFAYLRPGYGWSVIAKGSRPNGLQGIGVYWKHAFEPEDSKPAKVFIVLDKQGEGE